MNTSRLSILVSLLIFLFFAGCAAPQPPAAESFTATPSISPASTATNTPMEATPTMEIFPTASVAQPAVRIKNAETGGYLYEKDGQAQLGDVPASDATSLWNVEDYQGAKRIRNQASGNYLAIENLKEYVEIIPIKPEWMSPRWVMDGDVSQGSVVLLSLIHI